MVSTGVSTGVSRGVVGVAVVDGAAVGEGVGAGVGLSDSMAMRENDSSSISFIYKEREVRGGRGDGRERSR